PINAAARDGQMLFLFRNGCGCVALDYRSSQASVHNEVDGFANDLAAVVDASGQSVRPKWVIQMIKERVSTMLASGALLLFTGLANAENIDANSFRCITKMTPVRQFYVGNLLSVTPAMIRALQRTDPRCDNPVSPEDAEALKQLNELLKPGINCRTDPGG